MCVAQVHILDDAQKGAEDGLRERLAIGDGCRRIAPRSSWRPRPLIEIGEKFAKSREPSAGFSEGQCKPEGRGVAMNDGDTGARVGIDAGKQSHWAHMLDASGIRLLSRKVENDEAQLVALIEEVLSLAQNVVSGR
jgi:hypothetical protein